MRGSADEPGLEAQLNFDQPAQQGRLLRDSVGGVFQRMLPCGGCRVNHSLDEAIQGSTMHLDFKCTRGGHVSRQIDPGKYKEADECFNDS